MDLTNRVGMTKITVGSVANRKGDPMQISAETRYRVDGHGGIAFEFAGWETRPDEDTIWTGIEEPTGMALMVMVGDDRVHVIDPDDLHPLADEDYCPGCGQIGCGAYGASPTEGGER